MLRSRGSTALGNSRLESREVNNLLHTLRGEDFRHERNQNRAFVARPPQYSVQDNQTLPISQIFGDFGDLNNRIAQEQVVQPFKSGKARRQPEWRKRALSLLYAYVPLRADMSLRSSPPSFVEDYPEGVPSLTVLCLRVLATKYRGPSFGKYVVPYVPTHLRRVLLRWTAVHSPLSNSRLYALCDPDVGGHTEGELIVVGPYATLPTSYFKDVDADIGGEESSGSAAPPAKPSRTEKEEDATSDSWDSTSSLEDEPPPLVSLALLSTPLRVPTLFALPPTLTSLALLFLPMPTPIHRLPALLPLLEVLDLSYNLWLGPKSRADGQFRSSDDNLLERTDWKRWSRLKVLGLRECGAGKDLVQRVNEGRWVDVEVIGVMDSH